MNTKLYIETYGCQMNFADSDILASIMVEQGYSIVDNIKDAGLILINTCSIRDNAEQRIRKRLKELRSFRKKNNNLLIGIIGCMAERLKEQLISEEDIDIVVGPDAYRSLPFLIAELNKGDTIVNVLLSEEETYQDINPIRLSSNSVCAFISIMRGCQNFCSYCVVPYTRGVERSRKPESILKEAQDAFNLGYREITLLGQNVNSYKYEYDNKTYDFADILKMLANISPLLRLRFATSHPKDISDKLLYTIANTPNICNSIHLPVQSGSNKILKLMNRKYTREWYLERIAAIKRIIPNCAISTDIISGFCSETDKDHYDTLSLMDIVGYYSAFTFMYSEREGTYAAKNYKDDVPNDVKKKRLNEIISKQRQLSLISNKSEIGSIQEVLIERKSKRNELYLSGRTTKNKVVVFPANNKTPGEYVYVKINDCTAATLIGEIVN